MSLLSAPCFCCAVLLLLLLLLCGGLIRPLGQGGCGSRPGLRVSERDPGHTGTEAHTEGRHTGEEGQKEPSPSVVSGSSASSGRLGPLSHCALKRGTVGWDWGAPMSPRELSYPRTDSG